MNRKRVLLCGLLAGLVINLGEMAAAFAGMMKLWVDEMAAQGKTFPESTAASVFFIFWGFLVGMIAIWFYAGMREVLGPGAMTAVRVAIAAWILFSLGPTVSIMLMGFCSPRLVAYSAPVDAVITIAGTLAGAALYKDNKAARSLSAVPTP